MQQAWPAIHWTMSRQIYTAPLKSKLQWNPSIQPISRYTLLPSASLCEIVQERTFSIVKRFDALFRLTPYYLKQRRALQLLRNEIKRVRFYI